MKALKDEYHNFTIDEHFVFVLNWMEVTINQSEKRSANELGFKRNYSEQMFKFVNLSGLTV